MFKPSKNVIFHVWWGRIPGKKEDWGLPAVTLIQEWWFGISPLRHFVWCVLL